MGKYEPLPQFLDGKGTAEIRLKFAQIEKILGFKLPKSAYTHDAWWRNNASGHSHARAWLKAGWRTSSLDLAGGNVTFEKAATSQRPDRPAGWDPFGCMAGTITIMPGVDLTEPTESWDAEDRPDDVLG